MQAEGAKSEKPKDSGGKPMRDEISFVNLRVLCDSWVKKALTTKEAKVHEGQQNL
jgi:hypothetical protein